MKRVVCGLALMICSVLSFWFMASESCYAKEKIVFENVDDRKLSLYEQESFQVDIDKDKLKKKSKIVWKTSNKKVAKVNQKGKIKAVKPGKVKISATIRGGNEIIISA